MQRFDGLHYADPLDLLRRFIPTPIKAIYRVDSVHVAVATNDITLLPLFPFEADLAPFGRNNIEWKLIRDADCPGLLEPPICITSGPLTIIAMGPACLIGVDREKRELLAFIGAAIDSGTLQGVLIPLFSRLSAEMSSGIRTLVSEVHNQASANE